MQMLYTLYNFDTKVIVDTILMIALAREGEMLHYYRNLIIVTITRGTYVIIFRRRLFIKQNVSFDASDVAFNGHVIAR